MTLAKIFGLLTMFICMLSLYEKSRSNTLNDIDISTVGII